MINPSAYPAKLLGPAYCANQQRRRQRSHTAQVLSASAPLLAEGGSRRYELGNNTTLNVGYSEFNARGTISTWQGDVPLPEVVGTESSVELRQQVGAVFKYVSSYLIFNTTHSFGCTTCSKPNESSSGILTTSNNEGNKRNSNGTSRPVPAWQGVQTIVGVHLD